MTTTSLPWLERRVVFFGGKGGVGKTTCAAAFALLAAAAGRRVLLVSTDPAHSTADILDTPLGPEERPAGEGLWALEIDPEREADAYIGRVRRHLLTTTPQHLRTEVERQIDMARVSPGAAEAALFDRVADLVLAVRERWDTVVFDTAPTGHTLRLLTLPELLQAWIDGLLERRRRVNQLSALWKHLIPGEPEDGAADPVERLLTERRRRFYQMRQILLDPAQSVFVFVLTAERLPILETKKAVAVLAKYHVPVGGLIVNRLLPEDALGHPFLAARKGEERRHVQEIEAAFPDLPRLELPLLPRDVAGEASLREIAGHLRCGLQ
jgi:arsenite-transporting ATPase